MNKRDSTRTLHDRSRTAVIVLCAFVVVAVILVACEAVDAVCDLVLEDIASGAG